MGSYFLHFQGWNSGTTEMIKICLSSTIPCCFSSPTRFNDFWCSGWYNSFTRGNKVWVMKHLGWEIVDLWNNDRWSSKTCKHIHNTCNSVIYKYHKTIWNLSPALAARLPSFCVGAKCCHLLMSVLVPFLVPFLEHHPQCLLISTLWDKMVNDVMHRRI
jgi:hypothetical protein